MVESRERVHGERVYGGEEVEVSDGGDHLDAVIYFSTVWSGAGRNEFGSKRCQSK